MSVADDALIANELSWVHDIKNTFKGWGRIFGKMFACASSIMMRLISFLFFYNGRIWWKIITPYFWLHIGLSITEACSPSIKGFMYTCLSLRSLSHVVENRHLGILCLCRNHHVGILLVFPWRHPPVNVLCGFPSFTLHRTSPYRWSGREGRYHLQSRHLHVYEVPWADHGWILVYLSI